MTPSISESYSFIWTCFNVILFLAGFIILAFIFWYLRSRIYYQNEMIKSANRLVSLLEDKITKKE